MVWLVLLECALNVSSCLVCYASIELRYQEEMQLLFLVRDGGVVGARVWFHVFVCDRR